MARQISEILENPELANWRIWPDFPESAVPDTYLATFLTRQAAIKHYLDGAQQKECAQMCHVSRQTFNSWVKRCLTITESGEVIGWRGINKGFRSGNRNVTASSSCYTGPGSFTKLLRKYPTIETGIKKHALGYMIKPLGAQEVDASLKSVHTMFIALCREAGIASHEYPFNTQKQGRSALRDWFLKLMRQHAQKHIANRFGKHAVQHYKECCSWRAADSNYRPYQHIELDGHKIDGIFVVHFLMPNGREVVKTLKRIWLIVAVCTGSKAVLGYSISYVFNGYTTIDVLRCLSHAIVPWKPKKITMPGMAYSPGSGFPSGIFPHCAWRLFDLISLDNAKAHLADRTIQNLEKIMHADINVGPAGLAERRGTVERFNLTFCQELSHRLASTTGSYGKDTKRRDPEVQALKLDITQEYLEELIELWLAEYNALPHGALGGQYSPLTYIQHEFEAGRELPRCLAPEYQQKLPMLEHEQKVTIRAKLKEGRPPKIHFCYADYGSPKLSARLDLINKKVIVRFSLVDIRTLKVFDLKGQFIDEIYVLDARWRGHAHSMATRKAISQMLKRHELDTSIHYDLVLCFDAALRKLAQKDTRAVHKHQVLRQESGLTIEKEIRNIPTETYVPDTLNLGEGSGFSRNNINIIPKRH